MTQPRFWKNLPAPLRLLLRPWVIVSVGLHAVVLLLPLPNHSTSELPISEEPVRITQLPVSPSSTVPSPVAVPSPLPPSPTVQAPPAAPRPTAPVVTRPTAPPSTSPTPSPQASPSPTPQANPSPPSPTSSPQDTSGSTQPSPTASPTPSPSPEVAGSFSAEIPHAAIGGEPSCGGQENCWQTQDTQWRSVARALEQELQNEGYKVESQTDDEVPGFRVYEVSKDGETEYLNLLSTLQGTFYVLADQPMTRDQLEQLTEAPNS